MKLGVNTAIESKRKEIAEIINQGLQDGIPFSVMSLILEMILLEVRNGVEKSMQVEASENKITQEQIEWVQEKES